LLADIVAKYEAESALQLDSQLASAAFQFDRAFRNRLRLRRH
jgi:hypothetical protein